MKEEIWVHKLNEIGQEVWRYPGEVLEWADASIRLKASFDRANTRVGPLLLKRNDTFIETFFFDRWYNVFAVFDGVSGEFKGWYCNIARPAWIEEQHLFAEDLALDLVVLPDGTQEALDWDEFERLEISEQDRMQALKTMRSLQIQARQHSDFFSDVPSL